MTTTITEPEKEVIVKYKGWVVYKGDYHEYYTQPQRTPYSPMRRHQPLRPSVEYHNGRWVQHDHYKGGTIWASWEPKFIDNKCSTCHEQIADIDLKKLLCFGKAMK